MSFARALRIALRQLLLHRGSTLLALSGVIVCGAIFTIVLAVTYGQDTSLRSHLADVTPHITLSSERLDRHGPKRLLHVENGFVELVDHSAPTDRRELKPRVEVATRARRSTRLITDVSPTVSFKAVVRNGARFSS